MMPRLENSLLCLALVWITFTSAGISAPYRQQPPKLIVDTGVAEGKTEADVAKKKEFNPLLAEENLKVGNYYFKKKNYLAAINRYKEAIEYQPNLTAAYESLARAFEKSGDNEQALAVYQDFLKKYPESPKAKDFRSKSAKLEKKK